MNRKYILKHCLGFVLLLGISVINLDLAKTGLSLTFTKLIYYPKNECMQGFAVK